jgi:hypothetical protein
MSARRHLIAALSEDSMGGIATLQDVDHAEQLVNAHRAEILREAAGIVLRAFHGEPFLNYPPDFADLLREKAAEKSSPAAADTAPALMIYRASHDSIVMGHYTTREEARKHCETVLRREIGDSVWIGWVPDHGGDDAEEELCFSEEVLCSGYVVTPLEVAAAYDEDGDE